MLWRLSVSCDQHRYQFVVACDHAGLSRCLALFDCCQVDLSSLAEDAFEPGREAVLWVDDAGDRTALPEEVCNAALHVLAWHQADAAHSFPAKARFVFQGALERETLLAALRQLRVATPIRRTKVLRLERNEQLMVLEHQVVTVKQGLIRCMHLCEDGTLVLLGIYGPGDVLLGHDPDHCQVTMIAHTDATAVIQDWHEACQDKDFHERLLQRLCYMESWSTALAKSSVEERLTSVLDLLKAKFAKGSYQDLMQTLRLTHEHLAQALGSARPSISRSFQRLRSQVR